MNTSTPSTNIHYMKVSSESIQDEIDELITHEDDMQDIVREIEQASVDGHDRCNDDETEMLRRLKSYQPWAFFITSGGHFLAHFSRKCYSTVKQQLQSEAGFSSLLLSEMDSIFMASYAAGKIIYGMLEEMCNPTAVLAMGLFASGFCLFLVDVTLRFDFIALDSTFALVSILAVCCLFGFFQAVNGPAGSTVVGNWFCDKESIEKRGAIFGFWMCHRFFGDIAAALCTALVLGVGLPYWWIFLIAGATNLGWAAITIMCLVADPSNMGIITPKVRIRMDKSKNKLIEKAEKRGEIGQDIIPPPISYSNALCIPIIVQYTFVLGFFNITNYVLFFWLPYFLGKTFDPVTANIIAALYSVGMVPGHLILGYVTDLFRGRRAVLIGTYMGSLIVFLAILAYQSEFGSMDPFLLLFMLGCMGILVGGADNMIESSATTELASYPSPSLMGNRKSVRIVVGLINGCGSMIASIGLLAIGPLQEAFGWSPVWLLLMVCTAMGILLMSRKIYAELFPTAGANPVAIELV